MAKDRLAAFDCVKFFAVVGGIWWVLWSLADPRHVGRHAAVVAPVATVAPAAVAAPADPDREPDHVGRRATNVNGYIRRDGTTVAPYVRRGR